MSSFQVHLVAVVDDQKTAMYASPLAILCGFKPVINGDKKKVSPCNPLLQGIKSNVVHLPLAIIRVTRSDSGLLGIVTRIFQLEGVVHIDESNVVCSAICYFSKEFEADINDIAVNNSVLSIL